MKKIFFSIVLFFIAGGNVFGQVVTFQKTYGGANYDYGSTVLQTNDGGYIIAGTFAPAPADPNVCLIKTDANGDTLWTKTYDGANQDFGASLRKTSDGGYIIVATGFSILYDICLIKTDADGNLLWSRRFGGTGEDYGFSVEQTSDGGYIIAGTLNYSVQEKVCLVKTDTSGVPLWTRTFGNVGDDAGFSAQQTTDGGYIITGHTAVVNGNGYDVYLIKTDANGNLLWSKSIGGPGNDGGKWVQQTSDKGFIIVGNTENSVAGDDVYLIKTDSTGNLLWSKSYDATLLDYGTFVQQTTDGGYILTGNIYNSGTNRDLILLKVNAIGDTLWTKTLGTVYTERGYYVQQTSDGGYIVTGNVEGGPSHSDALLIKTDSSGNSGCNMVNSSINVLTPLTQVSNAVTSIFPPVANAIVAPVVGSGIPVITLCTSVGIQSEVQIAQSVISISPNPAIDNFTITFPNTINKGVIEIYNVLGKTVFTKTITAPTLNLKLQTLNFPAGVYLVKVITDKENWMKKIVKQ